MTALDDRLRASVLRLTAKLGKSVSISSRSPGLFNPATGERSAGSMSSQAVKSTPPGDYRRYFSQSARISAEDLQIGVAAAEFEGEPLLDSQVTIDTRVYAVTAVLPVYSGDQVCLWLLNLHRGG